MGSTYLEVWWRAENAPTAEEWQALFAGATFLVTLIAAVIALVQLRAHFATQWAQARPYLVVDFVFQSSLMYVEIRNISAAAAANVTVRVTPAFASTQQEDAEMMNRIFSPAWPMDLLSPGRRILHTLDVAFKYAEKPDFPQEYDVVATYNDATERRRRDWLFRRQTVSYTEHFTLSFAQWSSSSTEPDQPARSADALREIASSLKALQSGLSAKPRIPRPIPRRGPESVQDWLKHR